MNVAKIMRDYYLKIRQKEFGDYDYRALHHNKLISMRRLSASVVRLEKPSNPYRARSLGYKAKPGVIVALVRVRKGSGAHTRPNKARRPKRMGYKKLTRRISIQRIAEIRANKKFHNCEVLNSYWVGEDGKHKFYEVILLEKNNPNIISDKELLPVVLRSGRSYRGLTSAGKKNRGLRKKGKGTEKNRPSLRANKRKAK